VLAAPDEQDDITDRGGVPMETPYACYLQLPDLLGLQQPRSPDGQSEQWADERLFITVHQSAELLVSQALVDLKRAFQQARSGHAPAAITALRRVTAVICLLEDHLALLDHLTPERFASFRPLLDKSVHRTVPADQRTGLPLHIEDGSRHDAQGERGRQARADRRVPGASRRSDPVADEAPTARRADDR
jgi:hypothetical protein